MKPSIVTEQALVQGVAKRFAGQYRGSPRWAEAINRLQALPQNATAQDVADIIGNNSWTRLTCDQCNKDVTRVVVVGEKSDYESHTSSLCEFCMREAFSLMFPAEAAK